jgi:hypothetical protein
MTGCVRVLEGTPSNSSLPSSCGLRDMGMMLLCEKCGRGFLQSTGRPARLCPACRGTDAARYGSEHKKLRAQTLEAAYGRPCARCGKIMVRGQELHLDHRDGRGPGDYLGYSHSVCNTSAPHRTNGQVVRAAPRPPRTRPGPRRADVTHHAQCRCEQSARDMGAWPSRCW